MLKDVAATGSDRARAGRLIEGIESLKTRLLWFKIPPHRALQANETRVLRLTYDYSKKDWLLGAARNLKTGAITVWIPPAQPFPTFWILGKPDGYDISRRHYAAVKGGTTTDLGSWEDNSDAVFCKDTARSTSLRVKPDRNGAVLSYSLTPKNVVVALPVAATAMLPPQAVSVGASPHVGTGSPLRPIADAIVHHALPILLFIAASSLVVPRLIDDAHLRGALLWMYFVPVGLAIFPRPMAGRRAPTTEPCRRCPPVRGARR